MKLTLEHLAPYLPYGLKYKLNSQIYYYEHCSTRDFDYENSKPILRPLSDLTKEIEVNGEKFVPIDYFEDKYYTLDLHKQCLRLLENSNWINQSDYMLVDYLFSWHFDVFGLIDKGLAININDLNK